MDYFWFILLAIGLIFVWGFWFRDKLLSVWKKGWLIILVSLLGGVFSWSVIVYTYQSIEIFDTASSLYSALWGPIVEEIVKFIIAYSIIKSIWDYTDNPLWWLMIGIFVGLGFGLYENILYIQWGLEDIMTVLFRVVFVGGIILHPLTTGIAGFMAKMSMCVSSDSIFRQEKIDFQWVKWVWSLIKFIWKSASRPFNAILDFLKRVLILDVTVDHILLPKYKQTTQHGRAPAEIVIEWLMLAIWLHVLYNTSIVYIWENYTYLLVILVVVLVMLRRLIYRLFDSIWIGLMCYLVLGFGYIPSVHQDRLLLVNLILIIWILFLVAVELRNNFDYAK